MKVMIQCAGSKADSAGFMRTESGQRVKFVARPSEAPATRQFDYAHPDEPCGNGRTWREELLNYNRHPGDNPLGLLPAYRLYQNQLYRDLAEHVGVTNLYILSAGWGILPAMFLTPDYDITFTTSAESYKRRRRSQDTYQDYAMPGRTTADTLLFIGSRSYLKLFADLTDTYRGKRIAFFNTKHRPQLSGVTILRYEDATRSTNWQYDCARDFILGRLEYSSGR